MFQMNKNFLAGQNSQYVTQMLLRVCNNIHDQFSNTGLSGLALTLVQEDCWKVFFAMKIELNWIV